MPAFESIVLVEDWISEHYFTSDDKGATFQKQVLELRKAWDAEAKEGRSTVVRRFSSSRSRLQTGLAALGELNGDEAAPHARESYALLREILGIPGTPAALEFERGSSTAQVEGLWLGDGYDVLWLEGLPAQGDDALTESRLLGVNALDGRERADQPFAKLLSELYLSEPSPKYIVASVGGSLFLTERERWPEGRYLSADVQLIADRNDTKKGGEVDRLLSVFGRQSLVPAADGTMWWDERLEESHQHAVGVSQDLRDGIRESIEIIANDVLRRRTSQGLSNAGVDGQLLARQSLRFLYRILFLLYAEASPELGVLPRNQGEYDAGYGLERLRELVQVELPGHQSQQGTHLFESLDLLFRLVNGDHAVQRQRRAERLAPADAGEGSEGASADERDEGLVFEPLEADLFAPSSTHLISEVGLGNAELQRVLERLLLSKANGREERGFISYANLGINQLGAVYEGLMSYTGIIATTDLREVAKNGDASKGSWVVPADRIDGIDPKHFVTRRNEESGVPEPVRHPQGSFVFRLAGRERQQSASYYTPEVLTKFVVSQALEELLPEERPADDILGLSICEPALGSGAFAIEAVRQLADEYLKRKQRELDREIPADEYPQELQRVKAQIALHQVHGVDLNATAVELAEVSLWLDTMQPGLSAPWFGLRLKRGNSLIGARRATYSLEAVRAKKYLTEEPQAHPLTGLVDAVERDAEDPAVVGRIHHFLLPGEGWGAASEAKEVKDLAAEEQKALKTWAKSTRTALKKPQIDRLKALGERVEVLWRVALCRLRIAEAQARRHIDYWPHERNDQAATVTRAEIEEALRDPNGAYQRLKRVMNAWNALWFWPLTVTDATPPTVDEWIDALEGILGRPIAGVKKQPEKYGSTVGQTSTLSAADWNDLAMFEAYDFPLAGMKTTDELSAVHPWLAVCDRIAEDQGFFHWELEFASVFGRGGFDLQVGNPPWVRPRSDGAALLAEHDVWWQLAEKPSQAEIGRKRGETLSLPGAQREFIEASVPTSVLAEFLGAKSQYPVLTGLQPDLYRSFMARTWTNASGAGVIALIHPESHFTEKRAQHLRAATYRRLRRHWQFVNELRLFEIDNHVGYGVHVYGQAQDEPRFQTAASLYHPDTVVRSLHHEGGTEVPGLKTAEGSWDTRPHPERIVDVDLDVLTVWADILDEPGTSPLHARMVYPVNRASMSVLEKLSKAPRVRDLGLQYSRGWDESIDRKKGYFEVGSRVNDSWDDVILQGPHFTVANPFAKQPNPTMKSNKDWTEIDLEALPPDFIPRTSYQPVRDGSLNYDADYSKWVIDGKTTSSRDHFRIAWRRMAATTGVRTLHPAVLPPRASHVHPVYSCGPYPSAELLLGTLGMMSSVVSDFFVKVSGSGEIQFALLGNLPQFDRKAPMASEIVSRAASLVCLNSATAPLWSEAMSSEWSSTSPIRIASERRQALIELDALAALTLGLTGDELCTIYRTQFPVLRGYEQNDLYDANGRKVPGEMNKLYRKVGEEGMSLDDRRWTHPQSGVEYTFEFPFRGFDREEDMRAAYAKFASMLEEHGEILEESD
ncbi:N-6 DNA methylase [Zafaria sp. Z1313]|uniref:N-6 DNA methylase n=1 Tax=Zafaria sp. Z1313 TaxID=3423202 RepID=UPI003D302E6E